MSPERVRAAVAVVFFVNGALFANWAPRIPSVKGELGLDATTLGVALAGFGAGGLLVTLTAGTLVDRFGGRHVLSASTAVLGAGLVLPALAPSWWALFLALAVLGAADAVMDVAMNAEGVAVEKRLGRPLLNGFHAAWSVGAVAGGLAGTGAAALAVPVAPHLLAAGLLLGAVALAAGRGLPETAAEPGDGHPHRVARPTPALVVLCLAVACAALVEDAPQSWSAVHLETSLGAGPGTAGLAFVAFSACMMAGRLVGDRLVARLGPAAVVAGGGLLVACGFGAGSAFAMPAAAITAFALAGLGVSPMFPVAFSLAGRLPGTPPGAAIAMVSLVSRVAFLVAPLLVGGLEPVVGLGGALLVTVVGAGLALTALAYGLRRR